MASVGEWHWRRGVFIANHLCGVGYVVVRALFPFPFLNLFNRGVTSAAACVYDQSRFEKPDEVGYVCRFTQSTLINDMVATPQNEKAPHTNIILLMLQ
jgi:hypothetical protein